MPSEPRYIARLHGICEALACCWLIGLVLPHANALYNLGLFGGSLFGFVYLILTRGAALASLPRSLAIGFFALSAWGFMSCGWAPVTSLAFAEWRGNPGIAFVTAFVFASIFQDAGSQQRFWRLIVLLSAVLAGMFVFEWISLSKSSGTFIPPYPSMRSWGDRLILCFPFLIFAGENLDSIIPRSIIKALIVTLAILMIVTSARGVWLALIFFALSWAILTNKTRQLLMAGFGLCLIFGASLLLSENPLKERLSNITYTHDRVSYTWGPALRFWEASPLLGIGYGSDAFHGKAALLAKQDDAWLKDLSPEEREQMIHLGPHSNYLEVLAGGGVIGLLVLLFFYGQVIRNTFFSPKPINYLVAAAGSGIVVKYMIHGSVESINWKALGILIGLMVAALASDNRTAHHNQGHSL